MACCFPRARVCIVTRCSVKWHWGCLGEAARRSGCATPLPGRGGWVRVLPRVPCWTDAQTCDGNRPGGSMGSPSKRWNKLSLTRNWIFCVSGRLCQRLVDAARHKRVTAVGFEPTPLRTGALSQRLRPLGQTVLVCDAGMPITRRMERRDRGEFRRPRSPLPTSSQPAWFSRYSARPLTLWPWVRAPLLQCPGASPYRSYADLNRDRWIQSPEC